jgi:hypothetical protein
MAEVATGTITVFEGDEYDNAMDAYEAMAGEDMRRDENDDDGDDDDGDDDDGDDDDGDDDDGDDDGDDDRPQADTWEEYAAYEASLPLECCSKPMDIYELMTKSPAVGKLIEVHGMPKVLEALRECETRGAEASWGTLEESFRKKFEGFTLSSVVTPMMPRYEKTYSCEAGRHVLTLEKGIPCPHCPQDTEPTLMDKAAFQTSLSEVLQNLFLIPEFAEGIKYGGSIYNEHARKKELPRLKRTVWSSPAMRSLRGFSGPNRPMSQSGSP